MLNAVMARSHLVTQSSTPSVMRVGVAPHPAPHQSLVESPHGFQQLGLSSRCTNLTRGWWWSCQNKHAQSDGKRCAVCRCVPARPQCRPLHARHVCTAHALLPEHGLWALTEACKVRLSAGVLLATCLQMIDCKFACLHKALSKCNDYELHQKQKLGQTTAEPRLRLGPLVYGHESRAHLAYQSAQTWPQLRQSQPHPSLPLDCVCMQSRKAFCAPPALHHQAQRPESCCAAT